MWTSITSAHWKGKERGLDGLQFMTTHKQTHRFCANSVRRTTVSQWSTDQRHPRQRHTADQYLRCFPGNNVGPVSPRGMWFPAPSRTPRRAQAFMPAPLLASFFTSGNYFYLLESQLSYLEGGKPCFHKALVRLNEISVSGS